LTQFEFIFVLVSIILGLGLANLFSGISRRLQQPWQELDGIHLAFSFATVLSIFVVWWGMYRWQGHGQFEFDAFLIIALYTSIFYAMSVVLYPRGGSLRTFEEVRKPFYTTVTLYALLELPYYHFGGFARPSYYWFTWFSIGLFIAAIWVRRKSLDALLVTYWFALWGGWWFVTKLPG
jgi:hypothetical protein